MRETEEQVYQVFWLKDQYDTRAWKMKMPGIIYFQLLAVFDGI